MMRVATALPWILLASVVGYVGVEKYWPDAFSSAQTPASVTLNLAAPTQSSSTQALSGPISYAPAVAKAAPAVVNIYTTQTVQQNVDPFLEQWLRFHGQTAPRERSASSLGSGVIVSSDGYVLTNAHVVAGADEILVALHDGREVAAKLIGTDLDSDLAVLKIALTDLPALPFRQDPSAVGDVVLAIGNPFGVGQTVTQGIISALGRSGLGINTYEDFIQTDAAINPGNSGGALVDVQGNLMGINTAIYSRSGGSMGIGFAIAAPIAQQVLQEIIAHGHVVRGWLGVEIAGKGPLDGPPSRHKDSQVTIAAIMKGGPADRAGLKPGDELIRIESVDVSSADQVIRQIGGYKPEATVNLVVRRNKTEKVLQVTMGERPKAK
ncbi:MAG: trypsin-like peptidase domain-containing protein [Paraperlucidibaca sp.]